MSFYYKNTWWVIWLVALISVPLTSVFGSEIDEAFIKGNQFYQNGDYDTAITEYGRILESGFESWEVYYNLGNSYYKSGRIAHAILNFERAKRLNPKNEDIAFNLELTNLSVVDRIPVMPKFFLAAWIDRIAYAIRLPWLGAIGLSIYLLIITIITVRFFIKTNRFRRVSFVSALLTGVLLLLSSSLFLKRVYDEETRVEAIVLADKVDVKSAPGDAGTEVFTLHGGVKVKVADHSQDWVKIKLSDGKVGWLKQSTINEI